MNTCDATVPAKTRNWLPMPRYLLRRNLVLKLLKQVKRGGGAHCLEIGYGAGDMLISAARLGFRVDGYDFSPEACALAAGRISACPPTVSERISLLREERLIRPGAYDAVLAFEVLEHIQEDLAALQKFGGWLKPGGRLLLSMPAHMSKWGRNDELTGHYRRYEKPGLRRLLEQAGFRVLHLWNYGFPLTLILDGMLHRAAEKRAGGTCLPATPEELSQASGVRRNPCSARIVSNAAILFPFQVMQRWFLNADLGSCYLVMAEWPGRAGEPELR